MIKMIKKACIMLVSKSRQIQLQPHNKNLKTPRNAAYLTPINSEGSLRGERVRGQPLSAL
jgi:hypothetical protein